MSVALSTSYLPSASRPVRVLIVDDSAVVRQLLTRDLSRDPQLQVVGSAPDAYVARDKIIELQPDVLTLDVEMPRMDGITFLKKLMQFHPMPVIVLSSLTETGTVTAIEALAAGAVDVLCKPAGSFSAEAITAQLAQCIKIAACTKPSRRPAPVAATPIALTIPDATQKIFALGSSTGGVQALTEVFSALPANSPGTLVVQHMPPKFTASFAARLNTSCKMRVREAAHGDPVSAGTVLLAPGGRHMVLRGSGSIYHVELSDAAEVHHQRPSVDVFFESVAQFAGANAVGAILTGMGADGAKGLAQMRQAGAHTLAQDEATCVVFGMPMEAIHLGAAVEVLPLQQIASAMIHAAIHASKTRAA